ncbi:FmdB family transcriptional regulator [Rhodospirillum rubrum]|nr:FmdB family transcriptional regulator [Rhodospirillum rubrum]MBK1677657.1 FmdB family transcriptional regulator [Rhodospirillum rubrum]
MSEMPLYSYHCPACNAEFEVLLGLSETAVCPQCGASEPERLLGRTAAPSTASGKLAKFRQQAAREGHFSNYSKSEIKGKL